MNFLNTNVVDMARESLSCLNKDKIIYPRAGWGYVGGPRRSNK